MASVLILYPVFIWYKMGTRNGLIFPNYFRDNLVSVYVRFSEKLFFYRYVSGSEKCYFFKEHCACTRWMISILLALYLHEIPLVNNIKNPEILKNTLRFLKNSIFTKFFKNFSMKLGDFLLGYLWRVMQRDENLHTAILMQYDSFTSTLL